MADHPPSPDRFDEAIAWHRRRVPLTDAEWQSLQQKSHDRAFKVAGVQQAQVAQAVFDDIDRAIRDGTTLDDFKAAAGAKLAEAWGGEDAHRVETVFRTNVLHSYNAGRTTVFRHPAVKEARPYLRFDATEDSRTSEICDELDGTVLPADDPFWARHTPPLHYNCRSQLTPLDREEAADEGIDDGPPDTGDAEVDEGFGRPTAEYEPDTSGFDPEIRRILEARLR